MKIRGTVLLYGLVAAGCVAPTEELDRPELLIDAPAVLDLGWIAVDAPVEARFLVENVGESAVELDAPVTSGAPGVEIEARVVDPLLRPGEAAEVVVQVVSRAEVADAIAMPLVVTIAGLPTDEPSLPVVEVRARVSRSGLVAEPNPLTIGPVLYLETGSATVVIRNLRSSPLDLFALRHARGRAQYEEAVTRGQFGPLPEVDASGRIATLEPLGVHPIAIEYTAPDGPGEAKEQAVWRVGSCVGDPACALELIVQGLPDHDAPSLHLAPPGVHFGPISVGATVEHELRITNSGRRALEIAGATFSGSSELVGTLPADTKIEPGAETFATFRYTPANVGLDNAELVFSTNDPLNRTARVRVTGSGVILPPCRVDVQPLVLDFGEVEVFATHTLVATVTSVGDEECVAFDPQIRLDGGTEPLTFYFENPPPVSVTLAPNDVVTYAVTYAPTRPGRHAGTLVIRTSAEETIEIPLRGATPSGQVLSCTPDRFVDLEETVGLAAALAAGHTAQRHTWRLVRGPMSGGAIAATLRPDGPGAELIAHLVGTFVVEVEVVTTSGDRHTCQTEITAQSTGFRATLTWDGAGDLDLHLHRGVSAPWFGPADCHFDNLQPAWVAGQGTGTGPNPHLDGDDTSGDGPENIRIATPEIGVPYAVAVGHFERAQGRTAHVEIFCGRAIASLEMTSQPFAGNATGACTNNDFWTVATVTFSAEAQCTVQTIDTYRTTAEACTSF